MAASSMALKLACGVLMCMVAYASLAHAASFTCKQMLDTVAPCQPYLENAAPLTDTCCSRVKFLNNLATNGTTADRQKACKCVKGAVANSTDSYLGLAQGLPGKCGVTAPYPIGRTVNCTSVQ
ncbi:hypothetical protein Tsubulata_043528 [Turnera subulata]|uniref:Non-specific lipid-transfer protein n=1 Tax=Turnera subulata TaxID=218843 RepID=A0A9Q0FGI8_9ROSI|nr:hypothetical protein Tsubulata_043528 [Turnera subulata]